MTAWVGDPGGQRWSPSRPGLSPLPSSPAATWPHLEQLAGQSGPSSGQSVGAEQSLHPKVTRASVPWEGSPGCLQSRAQLTRLRGQSLELS